MTYDRAGRFRAFLTVAGADGRTRTDSVLVNVTDWESRHSHPRGEIVQVLGDADSQATDRLARQAQVLVRDGIIEAIENDNENT